MGIMIFRGRYENDEGIVRPYINGDILTPKGDWISIDFLIDTGADETFLDFNSIKRLQLKTEGIDVKSDVGGIGGSDIPYFQFDSTLKLISNSGAKIFEGGINVFLDPHACEVPLLGRDVLDDFIVIFDKKQNSVFLLDEDEEYHIG